MSKEDVDINTLITDVKEYVEAKVELTKLQIAGKVTYGFSSMVSVMIISFFVLIFLFILSITLAIFFSQLLGNYLAGFAIVTGLYLLCITILSIFRTRLLKTPLMNLVIKFIFEDKQDQIAKQEINDNEKI